MASIDEIRKSLSRIENNNTLSEKVRIMNVFKESVIDIERIKRKYCE